MNINIPGIHIADFDYDLRPDKIAQHPLAERDTSRLLIYRNGKISEDIFRNLNQHLPPHSLLVFNDTKVIRARLIFKKPTGAEIEIFCLEPISPVTEIQKAFQLHESTTWKCLVGNLKRWKQGILIKRTEINGKYHLLTAELKENLGDGCFAIAFRWEPSHLSFSEILEISGLIPLPPYIERRTEPEDTIRYQTIFAAHEGSVAAPTAGLHFTEPLLGRLKTGGFEFARVTLHVGVGTFRPVTVHDIRNHIMHHERIVVTRETIECILNKLGEPIIAVGTTSARTIESLYWLGVKMVTRPTEEHHEVDQWEPYITHSADRIPPQEALKALLKDLDQKKLDCFSGDTRLMIIPGYEYRILSGMITNFHMPQSTLLLLVAAMIGEKWKEVYRHALLNQFRFLSYGDSCLFFKQPF